MWRSISHASARRYTLFKVTSIDELDARTSSCNHSETALTNPIEYMYPPKWLRSLFMTRGRDSATCTWNMHVDTRIVCCDMYSFISKERESCGKWDNHLGEWNKLMYSDCRERLEHKGSFGFVQNAEKIVQVACFFLTETSNVEDKAIVQYI